MNMPKSLIPVFALFFAAAALSAQSTLGRITYLEGDVSLTRNGELLEGPQVSVGLVIEEFDTLETGADGYAEIELSAPSAGSIVKVKRSTAFYFEGTPRNSGWFRTTFQLLRGSLALKVGKLTGQESFQVQTDNAVMAVRGTEFTVDMSGDRSVLVTVPEGAVESSSDRGRVTAAPGTIAVLDSDAPVRALSVDPEDIQLYREYWKGLRQQALRINARLAIQQTARQWQQDRARLESAMRELNRHEEIYRKWAAVMDSPDDWPTTAEAIRDKREISSGIVGLRSAIPAAERTFQTLVGLEEAWQAGYAEGAFTIGSYRNAAAFYRSFRSDKAEVQRMLSSARRIVRIYRVIDRATGQVFESGSVNLMDTSPTL